MKTIRNPSQGRLFDPFDGVIGSAGRKHIENGWQSLFRDVILEQMPVDKVGKALSVDAGRPSVELHAIIGLLLIRDFKGWTVPETHEAILFRADIQYALNLEPGINITQRTIERYLARLQDDASISEELFSKVTDKLLRSMEVKVKKQRLDSTHVLSDMSSMGRARMIGVALKRLFSKLEKHDSTLLEGFSSEQLLRYRKQSDSRVFGGRLGTPEQCRVALQQAAEDLHSVLTQLANVEPVCNWELYQQLQTIFDQQCEVREEFVEVRKKTGGNIILNPSDPDATYCGNKGAGFQVQLVETFNEEGKPNLITSAKVETAIQNDANAFEPIVADLKSRDLLPEELLADAGYGSDTNIELAKKENVELIAPVPGGKQYEPNEVGYDCFELNDAKKVTACPAGHAPEFSKHSAATNRVFARMDAEVCNQCPLLEHCVVQRNKRTGKANGRVQFRDDAPRAAQRRRHEQTEAFRSRYRWRAGIEGTNGSIKRLMGMARLRVRGFKAVKLAILLKLTGWNLLRAVALRNRNARQNQNTTAFA